MKLIFKYIILASLPLASVGLPAMPLHAQNNSVENTSMLQNALRRIARNSNDSSALADAGLAALELGDTRAAIGFLAKADQIYPRSGRVKAGLARALLLEQNPFGALRYFNDAVANGIPLREIAADRGLAYDLTGRNGDAQRDYELAARWDKSDTLISRYAVSLGISGNIEQADAKLNPLLQKSDRDAWRNRAFILAMNGKNKDANAIARQTMQRRMAKAIKPFFDRMPKLTAAQKAAAVHFGHFPASENIGVDVASVRYAATSSIRGGDGADAGLIPLGQPLGGEVKKPRVLAMPDTSARRRPGKGRQKTMRITRRELKRLQRRGVKGLVVLSETELPPPTGVAPLTKVERPPLKSGLPAPTVVEKPKPTERPAVEKVVLAKAQPAGPPPLKPSKTGLSKPGFETALGVGDGSKSGNETKKPVVAVRVPSQIPAGSGVRKPVTITESPPSAPSLTTSSSTRLASVASSKPLVSESITRKVRIGSVKPSSKIQSAPPQNILPNSQEAGNAPTQMASFDLNSVPKAPVKEKPVPVQMAQSDVTRKPLADIIKAISIPDTETKTDVVPVDLETITPAKPKPKEKVLPKADDKKPEPKKEKISHPKRYWVQIATGTNLSALKYDYRKMSKKYGRLFSGHDGWTSPWSKTRRLVVGPFDNLGSAKKFEAGFRKGGGDGFIWVSSQGTEVNKLTK